MGGAGRHRRLHVDGVDSTRTFSTRACYTRRRRRVQPGPGGDAQARSTRRPCARPSPSTSSTWGRGIRRRAGSLGTCAGPCGRCSTGRLSGAERCSIVGVMLVHNEDEFVEQALRNVAAVLRSLPRRRQHVHRRHVGRHRTRGRASFDHVEPVRIRQTGDSHALVEGYAGTDTWVFGVDGDELYDPAGLAAFREQLLDGAHREWFSLKSNVLNVAELDDGRAHGERVSLAAVPLDARSSSTSPPSSPGRAATGSTCTTARSRSGPATTASRSASSATATHGRRAHCAASTCAFCAARASIHPRRRATAG